jgi:hypothetical protein
VRRTWRSFATGGRRPHRAQHESSPDREAGCADKEHGTEHEDRVGLPSVGDCFHSDHSPNDEPNGAHDEQPERAPERSPPRMRRATGVVQRSCDPDDCEEAPADPDDRVDERVHARHDPILPTSRMGPGTEGPSSSTGPRPARDQAPLPSSYRGDGSAPRVRVRARETRGSGRAGARRVTPEWRCVASGGARAPWTRAHQLYGSLMSLT